MIRKKSSFLTFCFSFLPGAGQMYMGFMKRGVSLMSAFFLLIFLSSWLHLGPLMFAIPVVWFYAFFDTFNLRSTPDDEFYALEDSYILFPEFSKSKVLESKYRNVFALALIVIGFAILWNNLYDLFSRFMPEELKNIIYRFGYYFPQLLIGFAIIALGLYLIRGKKKELDSVNDLRQLEDKGRIGQ
jgi:hypothetical protein